MGKGVSQLAEGAFYRPMSDAELVSRQKMESKMADNQHRGSTLDNCLVAEGMLEEFQAKSIKEVIAWQLADAMKKQGLTKTRLAALMKTSRTQIDRLLDPNEGNVTIETLLRAAAIVGRRVKLELL